MVTLVDTAKCIVFHIATYCLAVEPFLVDLRNKMEGYGLNVLGHSFITSAYMLMIFA